MPLATLTRRTLAALALLSFTASTTEAQLVVTRSGNGDIAVVFVHGLGGHPTKSFTNPDTGATWFDLLRSERELDSSGRTGTSVYIYSVDYADAADGELSIEDIATRLTGRGDWDKLFADHDNIWFVAHSMGGLVLKRALLQTDQFSKRPLSRVRGALFLGTPAKGAELANLVNELESRGLGGEWIARALGFNPAQVRELASDNTWLDNWNRTGRCCMVSGKPRHFRSSSIAPMRKSRSMMPTRSP